MSERRRSRPLRTGAPAGVLRRGRATTSVGALLALLGLLLAGCSGEDLAQGEARVLAGGTLEVALDDGWSATAVGDTIPEGARIRTGSAEARLELRSGEVWLAPSSMVMIGEDRVDVVRGDVLLASGGGLSLRWGDVDVDGEAVYRLTPGVSPLLRVYDGTATVARPGEERDVTALRQLPLASSRLPTLPPPLRYDAEDAWDRLLLPRAIAFDAEVDRIARGIDRQHGTSPQDAEFYETFAAVDPETIPVLAATSRIRRSDGRFGPPSDALVTLFVAEAVVAQDGGEIGQAARAVADLRSHGARWGVVALERDISTLELAQAVDLAQDRRLAVVGPEGGDLERPGDPPATSTGGDRAPSAAPAPADEPAPSAPAPPSGPAPTTPSPAPDDGGGGGGGGGGETDTPLQSPAPELPEPIESAPQPEPDKPVGSVVDDLVGTFDAVLDR